MIIFRYLVKEVVLTLAALTAILLFIFMSNQFVRYLNRAASGQIPFTIIMKLMMLELPNLIGLLLPLGFYVALLLAYGRLYAEQEMTVLKACGYGPFSLLKHSYMMAIFISLIVFVVMLKASPLIAIERAKLLKATGLKTLIQTIIPGRFTAVSQGQTVFYVESMSRSHTKAQHIFLARQVAKKSGNAEEPSAWTILWANEGFVMNDPLTHEDNLILKKGSEYEGVPGRADYQTVTFDTYKVRLPHPVMHIKEDIRTVPTAALWPYFNPDKRKAAELQWRLSVPLMVLILTLIALPLSRVTPRSGKFSKLLPAIVLYIVYANFMFVARDWIVAGKVPLWIGMWWIHLLMLCVGLALFWYQEVKPG